MAVMWFLEKGTWKAFRLSREEPIGLEAEQGSVRCVGPTEGLLSVVPLRNQVRVRYLLMADPRCIRINGRMFAGVRVLRELDEIGGFGGCPLFFSDEEPGRVVQRDPEGAVAECPICGDEVAGPAVRCPRCGIWHHESPERPCWSSRELCSTFGCPQSTHLNAAERWTPLDMKMGREYGEAAEVETAELV